MDITEQEAVKLGIEPIIYRDIKSDIDAHNKLMAKEMANDSTLKMIDPQGMVKSLDNYNNEEARKKSNGYRKYQKTRSNSTPSEFSGRITTSSETHEGIAYFAPSARTKKVIFRCNTLGNPFPVSHICKLRLFGGDYECVVISTVKCTGVGEVPVVASGCGLVAKITYRACSTNGGYCVWYTES